MSFELSAVDASRALRVVPGRPGPQAAERSGAFADALRTETAGDRLDAIPASPPPELADELLAAQRALEEMRARGRELHFEMADGRVRIELRDLDGNVLREIPAIRALEIAAGRVRE
jgi:hypothetical protein